MLTFATTIRQVSGQMSGDGCASDCITAVVTMLACALDKIVDCNNSLCAWEPVAQCARHLFGLQAIPIVWYFGESVPIGKSAGNWNEHLGRALDSIHLTRDSGAPAAVVRGNALALPWPDASFEAVITDPPYYDNIPYANLSDFFYVWLKRAVGHLYPEHFATEGTPKKNELVADASRHGGDKKKARAAYHPPRVPPRTHRSAGDERENERPASASGDGIQRSRTNRSETPTEAKEGVCRHPATAVARPNQGPRAVEAACAGPGPLSPYQLSSGPVSPATRPQLPSPPLRVSAIVARLMHTVARKSRCCSLDFPEWRPGA